MAYGAVSPEVIRNQCDIGTLFFIGRRGAPANRYHSEDIEVLRGCANAEDLHRVTKTGQRKCGDTLSPETIEDCLRLAVEFEARDRDRELEQFSFERIRIHVHDALRLFEGKPTQEKIVDQTEDRSV